MIFVFAAAITLYVGCLNGSNILHNKLLHSILRAPLNTFFDVTPIGRILNRFSKDVDTLDSSIPMLIKGWFNCFLSVMMNLILNLNIFQFY